MTKFYTDSRNYMSIRKYAERILELNYTSKKRLTHKILEEYFFEKKHTNLPKKLDLRTVNKEDVLKGKVILVKDEIGLIVPYIGINLNYNDLLNDLKNQKEDLTKIREKILSSQNYEITDNEYIDYPISESKYLLKK